MCSIRLNPFVRTLLKGQIKLKQTHESKRATELSVLPAMASETVPSFTWCDLGMSFCDFLFKALWFSV